MVWLGFDRILPGGIAKWSTDGGLEVVEDGAADVVAALHGRGDDADRTRRQPTAAVDACVSPVPRDKRVSTRQIISKTKERRVDQSTTNGSNKEKWRTGQALDASFGLKDDAAGRVEGQLFGQRDALVADALHQEAAAEALALARVLDALLHLETAFGDVRLTRNERPTPRRRKAPIHHGTNQSVEGDAQRADALRRGRVGDDLQRRAVEEQLAAAAALGRHLSQPKLDLKKKKKQEYFLVVECTTR